LKKIVKKKFNKIKLNISEKLGQALDIVGKPLMGLHRGDFIIFKPKMPEIIEFQVLFVI